MTRKITLSDEEWRTRLDEMQYWVTRQKGTERAFTGVYWDHHALGEYLCVCCGAALFHSSHKFDSGCGWPSFHSAATPANVEEALDLSHGMRRTEVLCQQCGAHLGHVFEDGPPPSGQRYCINSASIHFVPDAEGNAPPP